MKAVMDRILEKLEGKDLVYRSRPSSCLTASSAFERIRPATTPTADERAALDRGCAVRREGRSERWLLPKRPTTETDEAPASRLVRRANARR